MTLAVRPRHRSPHTLPIAEATQGLVVRRWDIPSSHVVFVKAVLEASEGVGALFAERGGALTLACAPGGERELERVLLDLAAELGLAPPSAEHAAVSSEPPLPGAAS